MQACSRRRTLSRNSAGGNGDRARLRKSQSDSAAVEKRKRSNFAAADKAESGVSSAVQLEKSHSDLPISRMEHEMFVDKEMDKNDEKPRSVEEEEEIPVSVEDEEKNQSLESLLSVDVVEKEQIVLVEDRNVEEVEVEVEEEEEKVEEEMCVVESTNDSKKQCVENAAMNPESEAQLPPPPNFEIEEEEEEEEEQEQEEMCEIVSSTRMQSIEDLVMWKDASRSALVFGFGTFVLLSSSYAEEVHFSMISASSYVGLVYLAFVFLCKSFIRRGENLHCDESCTAVEEEDAIWLLKMLLPYINELLLKLKTLFSGDPSTTLKLAGVLFVMARCGSNITIWSLVRLMFFGVFIVPKACSSYSSQLTKLGRFWLDRVRDGWESCTHKKALAIAIFCVIWNISSTIARVWSFFMLVVAVKLYHQSAAAENNDKNQEEEGEGQEDSMAGQSQQLKLQ